MTSTVQPSPTARWQPNIPGKGDPSAGFVWVGVILLVIAITLIFRPRGSNAD